MSTTTTTTTTSMPPPPPPHVFAVGDRADVGPFSVVVKEILADGQAIVECVSEDNWVTMAELIYQSPPVFDAGDHVINVEEVVYGTFVKYKAGRSQCVVYTRENMSVDMSTHDLEKVDLRFKVGDKLRCTHHVNSRIRIGDEFTLFAIEIDRLCVTRASPNNVVCHISLDHRQDLVKIDAFTPTPPPVVALPPAGVGAGVKRCRPADRMRTSALAAMTSRVSETSDVQHQCEVCVKNAKNIALTPCGHVFCLPCIRTLASNCDDESSSGSSSSSSSSAVVSFTCPKCRADVQNAVELFLD